MTFHELSFYFIYFWIFVIWKLFTVLCCRSYFLIFLYDHFLRLINILNDNLRLRWWLDLRWFRCNWICVKWYTYLSFRWKIEHNFSNANDNVEITKPMSKRIKAPDKYSSFKGFLSNCFSGSVSLLWIMLLHRLTWRLALTM